MSLLPACCPCDGLRVKIKDVRLGVCLYDNTVSEAEYDAAYKLNHFYCTPDAWRINHLTRVRKASAITDGYTWYDGSEGTYKRYADVAGWLYRRSIGSCYWWYTRFCEPNTTEAKPGDLRRHGIYFDYELELFVTDEATPEVRAGIYGYGREFGLFTGGPYHHYEFYHQPSFQTLFEGAVPVGAAWPDPTSPVVSEIAIPNGLTCANIGDPVNGGVPDIYFPYVVGGAEGTVTLYPESATITNDTARPQVCLPEGFPCDTESPYNPPGSDDPPPDEPPEVPPGTPPLPPPTPPEIRYYQLLECDGTPTNRWIRVSGPPGFPTVLSGEELYKVAPGGVDRLPAGGVVVGYIPTTQPCTYYLLTNCDDEEDTLVTMTNLKPYEGRVIKYAGKCWTIAETTEGEPEPITVDGDYEDCEECEPPAPCDCPPGLSGSYSVSFTVDNACFGAPNINDTVTITGSGCFWSGFSDTYGFECFLFLRNPGGGQECYWLFRIESDGAKKFIGDSPAGAYEDYPCIGEPGLLNVMVS